uniref:Uncharacterized protein n=1 Tax=Arion vulgaris TaxID=1028688 RepID=A0A0B6ZXJ7_9EUPU
MCCHCDVLYLPSKTEETTPSSSTSIHKDDPLSMETKISMKIIFEHPKHKTMSIYKVVLDGHAPLSELKEDMEHRLRTEPCNQVWYSMESLFLRHQL